MLHSNFIKAFNSQPFLISRGWCLLLGDNWMQRSDVALIYTFCDLHFIQITDHESQGDWGHWVVVLVILHCVHLVLEPDIQGLCHWFMLNLCLDITVKSESTVSEYFSETSSLLRTLFGMDLCRVVHLFSSPHDNDTVHTFLNTCILSCMITLWI